MSSRSSTNWTTIRWRGPALKPVTITPQATGLVVMDFATQTCTPAPLGPDKFVNGDLRKMLRERA